MTTSARSHGEHLAQARLDWARESLAVLAAVDDTGAPRARG